MNGYRPDQKAVAYVGQALAVVINMATIAAKDHNFDKTAIEITEEFLADFLKNAGLKLKKSEPPKLVVNKTPEQAVLNWEGAIAELIRLAKIAVEEHGLDDDAIKNGEEILAGARLAMREAGLIK